MTELEHRMDCDRDLIGAYLDGELSSSTLDEFEVHLKTCNSCQTELRAQQQLLCTLDAAFNSRFELPDDFARVIKARAEGDISGVRRRKERRTAFQLTTILALASFALLGTAWQGSILEPIRSIARAGVSILDLTWRTIYDAATGLAVIVRLAGQTMILRPHLMVYVLLPLFLLGISLLPHLIAKYHRAQTIE